MTADSQSLPSDASEKAKEGEDARGRSTIEFPYLDLASAIEVAVAIKTIGGTTAEWTQLAVKLDMAAEGGGFRTRLMTGKTFGLMSHGKGVVELTKLGQQVIDPHHERAAKIESFMTVPLYKALFDRLNGQVLPPAPAVERMAQQLGVAPKQVERARQTFIRSAKTAGLFELSADRLSLPPSSGIASKQTFTNGNDQRGSGGGGEDGGGGNPPSLRFEVPIPGKASAVVIVPNDLDGDDWEMLSSMITTYIKRWKQFPIK